MTSTWPEGVVARYLNLGGAPVDVTDLGGDLYLRYEMKCRGCPETDTTEHEPTAHRWAQRHADTCRAMPRPSV
ncbi:hypothetical protein LHJ74_14605 [Streptomyces sp. N2-109]|uniref:Uncharacterized protein n=1 Tax=Streptomyces gossypii TaxID=2883101 RepID=A0ABT2JUH3_9ACTN|nr:hypothetical protein [Streptomyces gossypii]MCT2591124.1 hypothetical protein [Streptomyces gossypii]